MDGLLGVNFFFRPVTGISFLVTGKITRNQNFEATNGGYGGRHARQTHSRYDKMKD